MPHLRRRALSDLRQNPAQGTATMCACTGPVGTGLCAVCVEDHGLNRTKKSEWTGWLVGLLVCLWQSKYEKGTLGAVCPILYEEPFFPWETKKKNVFALARPVVIDPPPDLPVSLRNSAPPFRRPRRCWKKSPTYSRRRHRPSRPLFFHTLLLSSFWTSRGHRFRPFSPSVLAFNFCRA